MSEVETSKQVQRWRDFSAAVEEHITNYVIPQYGDEGDEPAAEYDFEDCIKQAQRYLARAKTNQRPEGLERDMRKAAHWIQKAHNRLHKGDAHVPTNDGTGKNHPSYRD
jgi:TPR repeat protein